MLLADAMALQFSRPLFMIPLAVFFLGEVVGWRRTGVTLAGFLGIVIYARPFTAGFEPGVFIGALGAFTGGLVVICIKRLQTTEPTRVIMFYYAFWNTLIAAVPAAIWWVTPNAYELALLVLIGFVGISGQAMITHGLSQGDATVLVPLDYSRIVYSAIIGYLLFSEVPGPWSFAGMALIVGALALSRADGEAAAGDRRRPSRNDAGLHLATSMLYVSIKTCRGGGCDDVPDSRRLSVRPWLGTAGSASRCAGGRLLRQENDHHDRRRQSRRRLRPLCPRAGASLCEAYSGRAGDRRSSTCPAPAASISPIISIPARPRTA